MKRSKDKAPRANGRTEDRVEKRRESANFWIGVIGLILALSGAAAGVAHYYETRISDLRLAEVKREYETRENSLKREYAARLRSVEFGLGGKDQYLDVSKLLLPPGEVYSLPSNVKRFDLAPDIAFYVEDYPGGNWSFIRTNEFALTEMMVGTAQARREAGGAQGEADLKRAEIFLFRPPESVTLSMKGRIRDPKAASKLTFFPVIAVQPLDHKFWADVFDAPPAAREEIKELLNERYTATDPVKRFTADERLASTLDDIYRSDMAARVLYGMIDQGFKYIADYNGVEYRLLTVQKQSNVVFLKSRLVLNKVHLEGVPAAKTLRIDELVIFVCGSDRSFLIRTLLPSREDQPTPHQEWVRRWLAGFRVEWS